MTSRPISRLVALAFVAALVASGAQGAAEAREIVPLDEQYEMGSIVVSTSERRLYYALGNGKAIRYSVAVGKPGFQWFGESFVQAKRKNPGWSPTARMCREGAPRYVPPGPNNPPRVRALNLGWTEYRIYGTNAPRSIGSAASSGCIRMHNKDVVVLFERVHIGAPVYVIR
jgi:lipoprotein-anchoring transpeptidase ErfK/SrfK